MNAAFGVRFLAGAFLAAVFLAGAAFFAGAFFAGAFFARPSWPPPSWPGPSSPAAFLAGPSSQLPFRFSPSKVVDVPGPGEGRMNPLFSTAPCGANGMLCICIEKQFSLGEHAVNALCGALCRGNNNNKKPRPCGRGSEGNALQLLSTLMRCTSFFSLPSR